MAARRSTAPAAPRAHRKPKASAQSERRAASEGGDEAADQPEADAEGDEPGDVEVDVAIDSEGEEVDERALAKLERTSLAKVDALQTYMREVQRHPLLTPEEEKELALRYVATQDVAAAARMVTGNLRLVVKIAYEYRRAHRNIMDLVQEGNIGLMQAVKRFDPHRGVKLSSYAAWWIRAYMLRYILNNWRLVKIGTTQAQRKLFFNLNKEKQRLSALGIEATSAQIAESLQVDEKDVIEMDRRLARGDASLDAPVGDPDGRTTTRMDLLPASSAGPDLVTEGAELGSLLHEHLATFRTTLTGKDAQIFDDRIVADEPLTLQELGDRFGVSRERVRQLEARVTGKLRAFLREKLGDAVEVGS